MIFVNPLPDLSLIVGDLDVNTQTITPGSITMFNQVSNWIENSPLPDKKYLNEINISEGLARLFLYGSYLSYLADPKRADHPQIDDPDIGLISTLEMKRINIEISAIVAQMIQLRMDKESELHLLGASGYAHLPCDLKFRKQFFPKIKNIANTRIDSFVNVTSTLKTILSDDPEFILMKKNPARVAANFLTYQIYRQSKVIEDLNAGKLANPWPPYETRRINDLAFAKIYADLFELAMVVLNLPLNTINKRLAAFHKKVIYPNGWSLTEESSFIKYGVQ